MFWMWLTALAYASPLSLHDALGRALTHNPELQSERLQVAVIEQGLVGAAAGYDPELGVDLNAGGSSTPTNDVVDGTAVVTTTDRSVGVDLSQSVPGGGQIGVGFDESLSTSNSANASSSRFVYDAVTVQVSQPLLRGLGQGTLASVRDARLAVVAGELQWRQALEDSLLSVSRAYWGLVQANQGVEIADRALDLAETQLADTLERQEEGFAGSGEVLQVQLAVGAARAQRVEAGAAAASAEAALKRLIGLDVGPGEPLVPTDLPFDEVDLPSRDEVLARARGANSAFQLALVSREQARRGATQARNGALPSLQVNGFAGVSAGAEEAADARAALLSNPAPTYGVGLSLGLPLLLRDARSSYAVAALLLDQAELAFAAAEQDLVLSVDEALRDLERNRASLEVATQTLEVARLSLEAQQSLLEEGRGSTRDVVDALEALRLAEAAELSAKIALENSANVTRRVAGTLVGDLDVDGAPR